MAVDINSVNLVGRLTKDCELRSFPNGTVVSRFAIAVNRRKKNGEIWEDEPNFFEVVLYGKQADSLKTYLTKGTRIGISGEIHQNRWTGEDGQTRQKVEIIARSVELLSSNTEGSNNGTGKTPYAGKGNAATSNIPPMPPEAEAANSDFSEFDDADIPF